MSTELPMHMYVRPLTLEDVEAIRDLESVGFPPSERCSLENITFRITNCPELCSGLFIRKVSDPYAENTNNNASNSGNENKDEEGDDLMPGVVGPYDAGAPKVLGEELIGHILATKINSTLTAITLESMSGEHDESSNYIAIHSLVIDPKYQKKNLATLLMTDYIQKLSNQEVGTKITIIAHEHLFPFYERLGFKKLGPNENVNNDKDFSAHGVWYNMERDLIKDEFEE
ncbi:hypothetical protein ACO0RG_002437 [Hanseniaspora osmophila]